MNKAKKKKLKQLKSNQRVQVNWVHKVNQLIEVKKINELNQGEKVNTAPKAKTQQRWES